MQPQVKIELELRLAKATVSVYAFVTHMLASVSRGRAELVVFTRLFDSAVISRH